MSDDARELWESLLAHPGWTAFCAHVDQEWGEGGLVFKQQMKRALDLTDNNAAASQARQILSGQAVIVALMRWPAEELARAQKAVTPETRVLAMTRRGGL